jgi:folylpolyglutamate synthase/dihydropteroate synthase
LSWDGNEIVVRLPLPGAFQRDNLELAVALALEAVNAGVAPELEPPLMRAAIENVSWPGRLSRHRIDGREVLLDCAHNLEAAQNLARHLSSLDHRYNLLFSCLDDKPVEAMAEVLQGCVDEVVVCQLDDERAMPVDRLASAFVGAQVADGPGAGLEKLHDPVLAAGSIRLVGALLALVEMA